MVWLLRSGCAALAFHTVADAFVFPQAGTAWHDHLSAGLVPLALLGLVVVAAPRLRPGAQAAVAGILGALALEGAGLAAADAARTFARPSDWTGFLLAPTGLALLAGAAVTLWRKRRRGVVRRLLVGAAVAVGAYWLLIPVGMGLYATHRPRGAIEPADLAAPYRHVTVPTSDGLDLAAWYAPSRNGAAVISFPTRLGKLPHARMLIRHGYGVLLLDMRGYEESEGSPNAFGWGSTRDIDAGVAFLQRQRDVRDGRIGGIGFSVGGEQMLEAAAENHGLRAVVSEGAGERSFKETLLRGPRGWAAVPMMALESATLAVFAQTMPPPALDDVAARIAPGAAFFVYAEHGAGGEEMNPRFFDAARQPKALWEVPGAHHTGGLDAQPRAYERRVVGFFDRYLAAG